LSNIDDNKNIAMSNKWISPRIIIGNKATGDSYYHRPALVEEIWEEVEKGNNVLIAAPRRVGKSSVMIHMANNCPDGYKCIFESIQGIKSETAFYSRIYNLVIKCLSAIQKGKTWITEILKTHGIEEVSADGTIKFKSNQLNYLDEINRLLPKLSKREITIVLFIDELPEVLHNLNKAGKSEEAGSILENIRRWRQEDEYKNLRFVLAGSIGIHYVVKQIKNRTTDINDIKPVKFEALEGEDAIKYIEWATGNNATVKYSPELTTYLLEKTGQYVPPYFINLMLDEINKGAKKVKNTAISKNDIDAAFEKIIKESDHFKDWKSRIFDYMPADDANFVNTVLIHIAHRESISIQKIYDIAGRYNQVNSYMDLIDDMTKDGYITEVGEVYIFQSPFLKAFWKRNNRIYNE
jgi:uncharacterized protein